MLEQFQKQTSTFENSIGSEQSLETISNSASTEEILGETQWILVKAVFCALN